MKKEIEVELENYELGDIESCHHIMHDYPFNFDKKTYDEMIKKVKDNNEIVWFSRKKYHINFTLKELKILHSLLDICLIETTIGSVSEVLHKIRGYIHKNKNNLSEVKDETG